MRLHDVPVLSAVVEAGPDDRLFDALLLSGPVLILLVIQLGRNTFTIGLAGAYLLTFVVYVLYRGLSARW